MRVGMIFLFCQPYTSIRHLGFSSILYTDHSSAGMDDGLVLNIAEGAPSGPIKIAVNKSGRWTDR